MFVLAYFELSPKIRSISSPASAPNYAVEIENCQSWSPIFGEFTVSRYQSANQELEYLVGSLPSGHAWIASITSATSEIGSFGLPLDKIWYDLGLITEPLIEHGSQRIYSGRALPGFGRLHNYLWSPPQNRLLIEWYRHSALGKTITKPVGDAIPSLHLFGLCSADSV